jgi:HK97 family phage portal protein
MAWNRHQTKSLQSDQVKQGSVGPGAPVSLNPGVIGRGYSDGWSIQRAYSQGMQRITWVARCLDVIAGNQARLPVMLRRNNDPDGAIITGTDSDVLKLLNQQANEGENAFTFRYRMSTQLLMSSRGVFIEKVYSKSGKLLALNLLPPDYTKPIPDPFSFVSGYEMTLPTGSPVFIPKDNVLWIRKPHPIDPYLSLTPMEAAGIAMQIENLAKQYNLNFLQQDGRPGLLLIAHSEVDIDDRAELEGRFNGGPSRAGKTTLLGIEGGMDAIDMGASPRDANYIQMREITKEEILSAFGVPESAIGNASGRTFSNASEEMRIFWLETMQPHLHMLARGLDALDDKNFVDFNDSKVPIMVLLRQEQEKHRMEEFKGGLISANEYRIATGRDRVKSELADSLLADPNLTPIANTEHEFKPEAVAQGAIDTASPVPGEQPGALPPAKPQGALPAAGQTGQPTTSPEMIEAALRVAKLEFKAEQDDEEQSASARWILAIDTELGIILNDQERDIVAKVKKGASLAEAFDVDAWNRRFETDIRPIVHSAMTQAAFTVNPSTSPDTVDAATDQQMQRFEQVNQTTLSELAALWDGEDDDNDHKIAAIAALFVLWRRMRKRNIAEHEGQSAWNGGIFVGAASLGPSAVKTWISQRDGNVRSAHQELDGMSVPVFEPFRLHDGRSIRFPGDPLAMPSLTIGCRCRLRFGGVIK